MTRTRDLLTFPTYSTSVSDGRGTGGERLYSPNLPSKDSCLHDFVILALILVREPIFIYGEKYITTPATKQKAIIFTGNTILNGFLSTSLLLVLLIIFNNIKRLKDKYLFLHISITECVCVCVCVREREREMKGRLEIMN